MIVNHLIEVLVAELGSSARVLHILNCGAISSVLAKVFLIGWTLGHLSILICDHSRSFCRVWTMWHPVSGTESSLEVTHPMLAK